ncbi:hypothetical protein Tco_1503913 [Tanacetum coccineum]
MRNHKNVSQDIRDQLNAEAEAVQIILTGIDNNIYSTVDACTECIENVENHKNLPETEEKQFVTIVCTYFDPEPCYVLCEESQKEKEIDKLMALISLSFKKIYKPTNNNLRTSSNTSRANQDNSPRINRGTGYDNQRAVNVAGARENIENQNISKDAAYHKEKMLLCKQEEAEVQLNAEQADWKDDTDG